AAVHIVDAHHHLWDPADRDYPFMRPAAFDPIRRRYGLDDLRARADAAGVAATVLVQTVSDTTETREFLDVAAASDGLVAGVVGWADLTSPAFAAELDAVRSRQVGESGGWSGGSWELAGAGWLTVDVGCVLRREGPGGGVECAGAGCTEFVRALRARVQDTLVGTSQISSIFLSSQRNS